MVRYLSNIRSCSFNIEGLKNKLEEKEFYDTFSKFDFITLVEAWLPDQYKIDIPNFYVYSKYRKKHKKARRYSGGISVVIRKDLKAGVKFFSSKSDFYYGVSSIKPFLILMKIFMFAHVIFPPRILKANHC